VSTIGTGTMPSVQQQSGECCDADASRSRLPVSKSVRQHYTVNVQCSVPCGRISGRPTTASLAFDRWTL